MTCVIELDDRPSLAAIWPALIGCVINRRIAVGLIGEFSLPAMIRHFSVMVLSSDPLG